jgi:sigma-54 dependent transcriptional regulator, acetoin dehydrogenase operon transcriptional activator AcoR
MVASASERSSGWGKESTVNSQQGITDVAAIRRAYGQFLSKGRVPPGSVPDYIERSWQRSVEFGVTGDRIREIGRVDESTLRTTLNQYGSLIHVAAPVMQNLHHQLTGSGSVVLLCSGDGYILHSMGDPDFLPKAQHIALKPGVCWAENQKGTNAIGTAIVERQPVVVYAGHHFIRQNHFLACSAAPVLDPFGEVAGVLDITCDYRYHQRHTLALVQMSVRVIERQMFQYRFGRDVIFNVHPERSYLGSPFDVQVAFSSDGKFLSATPATCDQIYLRPGEFHGRFAELFDAPFEQTLDKLRSASNSTIQLRLRGSGAPVYLQFAHHAVTRTIIPSTAFEAVAIEKPRAAPPARKALTLDALIATDAAMRTVIDKARRTLGRNIPIVIEGETGTGKEWFARAIHQSGPRAAGEFVALNCAAIQEASLAAQLFGLEDGATPGGNAKVGMIRRARGGTLFLDEVAELPPGLQARLLGVLHEGAPADGTESEPDVALVCATHHRLADMVKAGHFREDLYYRLNGLTLTLPPLRQRQDIVELAKSVLLRESRSTQRAEISEEVLKIFGQHPWPGNLRQMHSVIRAALAMVDEAGPIEARHLAEEFLAQMDLGTAPSAAYATSLDSLEHIELHAIQETIRHNRGNISAAARQLGVSRTTLYRKLKQSDSAPTFTSEERLAH